MNGGQGNEVPREAGLPPSAHGKIGPILTWLTKHITAFAVSAVFALLIAGFTLIYPEPSVSTVVVGLVIFAFGLALFLAWLYHLRWSFKGARFLRFAIILCTVLSFGWLAIDRYAWAHRRYATKPPITYPWLSVNSWKMDGQRINEVFLRAYVREYPSPPGNLMPLSSLYNLRITVITPLNLRPTGQGFDVCVVSRPTFPEEWTNTASNEMPLRGLGLKEGVTILEMSGTSRNASWFGLLIINNKGNELDWEGTLGGTVMDPDTGDRESILVGETHTGGKSTQQSRGQLAVTPELFSLTNPNAAKELCLSSPLP